MRALIVFCHPHAASFNAAVRDVVVERLRRAGAEYRICDLYARGFQPVLTGLEWQSYLDCPANQTSVDQDVADLRWCNALIFVYPTWWYGLPAMLKGWLDRVMLPDVAFLMPSGPHKTIRPGLHHIKGLAVFTTCGASRWLTWAIGAPGRRTLMRGVGLLCAPGKRTAFAAHYLMDSSSPDSRMRHLDKVAAKMDRFIAKRAQDPRHASQRPRASATKQG
jgi:NAD(P)H dehydrogenase (quinone)